jgi:hypothetical protein
MRSIASAAMSSLVAATARIRSPSSTGSLVNAHSSFSSWRSCLLSRDLLRAACPQR